MSKTTIKSEKQMTLFGENFNHPTYEAPPIKYKCQRCGKFVEHLFFDKRTRLQLCNNCKYFKE